MNEASSHMNQAQILHLKMLFVEAKPLYNFALSYVSIKFQKLGAAHRFYDEHHIGIQFFFKKRIRIKRANQCCNIPGIEFAG